MDRTFESLCKRLEDNDISYHKDTVYAILDREDDYNNIDNLIKFVEKSKVLNKIYKISLYGNSKEKIVITFGLEKDTYDIMIPKTLKNIDVVYLGIDVVYLGLVRLHRIFSLDGNFSMGKERIILDKVEQLSIRYTDCLIDDAKLAMFVQGFIVIRDKKSLIKYMYHQLYKHITHEIDFIHNTTLDSTILRYIVYMIYNSISETDIRGSISEYMKSIEKIRDSYNNIDLNSTLKREIRLEEMNKFRELWNYIGCNLI